MSLLARYRRNGGFAQLVSLIEACNPDKQRHLLELVGVEDPGWAVLVHQKVLSADKIFSWTDEVVGEVLSAMPVKIAAFACHQTTEVKATNSIRTLPHQQACQIMDAYRKSEPTPNERHAACVQMIRAVRDLEREGKIRLHNGKPGEEIDDRLIG